MRFEEHSRHPTSAAYHRRRKPARTRALSSAGAGGSETTLGRPFGGLPNAIAGRTWQNILGPLERYLGLGPAAGTRAATRQSNRLDNSAGGLAGLIRPLLGLEAGIVPEAQGVGANISARGSAAFTTLQGAIDEALKNLPQFQNEAAAAGDYASRYTAAAFSPVANEDLFQTALRRAEGAARPGQVAAGTLGTGAGDQSMQDMIANLAFQFGGLQKQQQETGIGMLGQAAGQGAQLTAAGPALGEMGMQAVPQLAQALAAQWGIPMEAAGQFLSMIMGSVNPSIALTGATSPVPLSSSSYWSF